MSFISETVRDSDYRPVLAPLDDRDYSLMSVNNLDFP